ncbi:hypothetical protein [Oceanithermus sp.]
MMSAKRLSTLAPEARAEFERELRSTIVLARERARRRRYDWHTLDLGPYRVALRVQRHRLGWPLELLVAARHPIPRDDVETLAEMAGMRYTKTDDFPGNQVLITEVRLAREAEPNNRPDRTPATA